MAGTLLFIVDQLATCPDSVGEGRSSASSFVLTELLSCNTALLGCIFKKKYLFAYLREREHERERACRNIRISSGRGRGEGRGSQVDSALSAVLISRLKPGP